MLEIIKQTVEWDMPDFSAESILAGEAAAFERLNIPGFVYKETTNTNGPKVWFEPENATEDNKIKFYFTFNTGGQFQINAFITNGSQNFGSWGITYPGQKAKYDIYITKKDELVIFHQFNQPPHLSYQNFWWDVDEKTGDRIYGQNDNIVKNDVTNYLKPDLVMYPRPFSKVFIKDFVYYNQNTYVLYGVLKNMKIIQSNDFNSDNWNSVGGVIIKANDKYYKKINGPFWVEIEESDIK